MAQSSGIRIEGLGTYRQNAGPWAGESYKFGYLNGTFGQLGCVATSLTNLMAWGAMRKGIIAPTPSDTNHKNHIFAAAFSTLGFYDMTSKGLEIYIDYKGSFKNQTLGEFPIPMDSSDGRILLKSIKGSISRGYPVFLGFHGEGHGRHTILAAGLSSTNIHEAEIMVVDPYLSDHDIFKTNDTGKAVYAPLSKDVKKLIVSRIDEAYSVYLK